MTLSHSAILSYAMDNNQMLPPPPPPPPGPPPDVAAAPVTSLTRPLPSVESGGWKCGRCGNVNYSHKLFCNMRKCNAPKPLGSWTCHSCGSGSEKPLARDCSKCLTTRNTTKEEDILIEAHRTGALPSYATRKNSFPQEFLAAPFGSWICVKCNNVNWPARTTCNGRHCQKSRDVADIEYTRNFRLDLEKRGFAVDLINTTTTATVPSCSPLPGSTVASGSATPTGVSRGVLRDAPQMPAPRLESGREGYQVEVVDMVNAILTGEPPRSSAGHALRTDPPGSWICPTCGNVNWPKRTHCNKHGCGVEKPAQAVVRS
ncbi:hypothetical protein FOL47_009206 [Perkinsus chesapeaki]|uniref:RanBP2-type domain-containing protein n=1 Tax=Perkinsus chesapeaki TaxID=330153 RepID=A0A7J6LA45_PERCH|nr:hypothetical protein FOL47_009206 [Perkinsus chesapeaki]